MTYSYAPLRGGMGRRVGNSTCRAVVMRTGPERYLAFVFCQQHLKTKDSKCKYVAAISSNWCSSGGPDEERDGRSLPSI